MSLLRTSEELYGDCTSHLVSRRASEKALPATAIARRCRELLVDRLANLPWGTLTLCDAESSHTFRGEATGPEATIRVHNPRLYPRMILGGSLAAAEAYCRGDWDSAQLVDAMRILTRHAQALERIERPAARWLRPWRVLRHWLRGNSPRGSRQNIAAHYDLSNDFFALMLDPTMTYSSGIFEHSEASMEEASTAKYERICSRLKLQPGDELLEIGTGWGGFALHAARNYGCRITTTTISKEQYQWAEQRFREAGVEDRVTLLLKDYRDLSGQFDKLVSIEMIEAVGEQYLDTFFAQCARLLRPKGAMLLQAITIPDHRYDEYRRSVDFIQRYVFPGGFLPSFSAIGQSLRRVTDFRLVESSDFGMHYAETLHRWRSSFMENLRAVQQLGFDDRFVRTWNYYLCYCEAGFRERQIGVNQLLLTRPDCRLTSELGSPR